MTALIMCGIFTAIKTVSYLDADSDAVVITGEVRYIRNGHYISTLMHVDTSLPLWAFLDIYGSMKEIKSVGKCSLTACEMHTSLIHGWCTGSLS